MDNRLGYYLYSIDIQLITGYFYIELMLNKIIRKNNFMKGLLLLSILTFNILFVFAQITVKGRIVDCETKVPLKSAGIGFAVDNEMRSILTNTIHDIPTDRNGNFEFEVQKIKNDSVKISYLGYSRGNSDKTKIEAVVPFSFLGNGIEIMIYSLYGEELFDGNYYSYHYYDDIYTIIFDDSKILVFGSRGNEYIIENGEVNVEVCLQENKEPRKHYGLKQTVK